MTISMIVIYTTLNVHCLYIYSISMYVQQQSSLFVWLPLLSTYLYLKVTHSCPVIEIWIWIEPLVKGHLSYMSTFSLSQRWPLNTGLIVYNICHDVDTVNSFWFVIFQFSCISRIGYKITNLTITCHHVYVFAFTGDPRN